ncbi:thyroliberin receptor [Caerostris darwini]|uniref:Thyrotropin-releasing hormone receptor n=1 Tax=Caerostris darwini TaxID=1538125 RepID=A0AAV4MZ92_9ARAC|nr:thyroliberin receptor [Caerostris darwini]
MADCDSNGTSFFGTDCNSTLFFAGLGNASYNETSIDKGPEYLDPSYYSINYRIVGTVFQGIVFIVGVLGNIMVVIVVWQTRSMHTPTNCYLVSLSIADFMVLIASVPNEILAYFLLGKYQCFGFNHHNHLNVYTIITQFFLRYG